MSVRIRSTKVEKINAAEDDEESTKERDGVDCIRSVESSEKNKGSDEGCGGECYIVNWRDYGA